MILGRNDFGQFQKLDTHPLKKTWESQKCEPLFFLLGIPKKLIAFSVTRVKKTWKFSKMFNAFGIKNEKSQFFYCFLYLQLWEFCSIFFTNSRIPKI